MSLRRILTIFRKDLRDAIRDARVLIALITPLGIGIFYSFLWDDDVTIPPAEVIVYEAEQSTLPDAIRDIVGGAVRLTYVTADSDQAVRDRIAAGDSDLGLVIPAGFDAALVAGEGPTVTVLFPESLSIGGNFVAEAVDPAIRLMAGQAPPATIAFETMEQSPEGRTVVDQIGFRTWSIYASFVLMVAMIGMLAIPVVLAEETEKKTMDALVMIANNVEIIAAKALLGLVYVAIMVTLLLGITQSYPADWPLFVGAITLLGLTLIGAGLLMAGFFKSASQLNTWSGVTLLPIIFPAFIVGLGLPDRFDTLATLLPSGAGAKLLFDSASEVSIFNNTLVLAGIVAAWGIAAYLLLFWQLRRRTA
jgi:hypothetical protein